MKKEFAVTIRRTVCHDFTVYVEVEDDDPMTCKDLAADKAKEFVEDNSYSILEPRKVLVGREFGVVSVFRAVGATISNT
jgi:hypothetical protein